VRISTGCLGLNVIGYESDICYLERCGCKNGRADAVRDLGICLRRAGVLIWTTQDPLHCIYAWWELVDRMHHTI
jgi:hypothetical protein